MSQLIKTYRNLKALEEKKTRAMAQIKDLKRQINQLSMKNAARAAHLIGEATVSVLTTGSPLSPSAIYQKAMELARPSDVEALERIANDLNLQEDTTSNAGPDFDLAGDAPNSVAETDPTEKGDAEPLVTEASASVKAPFFSRNDVTFEGRLTAPSKDSNRLATNQKGALPPTGTKNE
jgi:hypothetical protein